MSVESSRTPFTRGRLVLFSLVTVVLFFALAEGISRLVYRPGCGSTARVEAWLQRAGANPPRSLEESFQRSMPMPYDPYLIWHLILNFRGFNLGVEVVHNSRGLRSPEVPLEKPPGTTRVLLLGDSTIYGHGVEAEAMLRARLERRLREALPGRAVEVVNGGIPGYSSLQSLNLLRRVVGRYEPDLVVVANLWSDCIYDQFEDREKIYGRGAAGRIAVLGQRLDEAVAPDSALYCLLKERVLRIEQPAMPDNRIRQPGASMPSVRKPRVAPADYEENLLAIAGRAKELGAEVAFVMLANKRDVGEPDDSQPTPDQYQPYRQLMRAVAERLEAPIVDLPAAFSRAKAEGSPALFLDLVHPTAAGNAVMAEALGSALLADGDCRRALDPRSR